LGLCPKNIAIAIKDGTYRPINIPAAFVAIANAIEKCLSMLNVRLLIPQSGIFYLVIFIEIAKWKSSPYH